MRYAAPAIPDTSSLRNFAAMGEMGLLRQHMAGEDVRWVEAVAEEVRSSRYDDESEMRSILDHSLWLGNPIEFTSGLFEIDLICREFGGRKARGKQREHLGEAQCIYALETLFGGHGTLLIDDLSASGMVKRRGLICIDTFDVLRNCYCAELLRCPRPFDLLVEMKALGRGVRMPDSHSDIC